MPAITVKNIPEDLYKRIKESATTHHRSINNEIIFRLNQALSSRKIDPEKLIARVEAMQESLQMQPLTEDFLKEAKNGGRL